MELATHVALQGLIDKLMLPDAVEAFESLTHDRTGIMVTVPGQIINSDLCIGERLAKIRLKFSGGHRHGLQIPFSDSTGHQGRKKGLMCSNKPCSRYCDATG